ncbi:VOC family protein [Thermomonospora umbrina]|uniref:Putative glyoxalase superfamily protein PhnB n=1 Tax=Thermomonospora umbrina TaxID=111806 RepID=A0A3D9SLU4_9ACTN|nr:VOC family protein [Thermomonospora umbrina]REE94883.1 putative glyoxalase superfamily protein PhnB [Thermomonospora umbrina]
MTTSPTTEPTLHTVNAHLAVDDGRRALEWYPEALGARLVGEPTIMDDGRVGHAELALGDSVFMLADEWPELDLVGPRARGGASVSLYLRVPDADAAVARAVERGAELERPVDDAPHGRNGVIKDPFGHRWMVVTPTVEPAASPRRLRRGDVGYVSLWVPDVERAAAFYQAVLGWRYQAGSTEQGRRVEGLSQPVGLWGGREHRTLFTCFAVDDVGSAVRRIRDAGGRAEEPHREPYGLLATCEDDQGLPFAVFEPVGDATAPGSPGNGEISYLTFEVPDSARFRAFFGAVLGWEFVRGTVEDGWEARIGNEQVRYMVGMHGGHERSAVVPMYAVDDIDVAVANVRAAGGTATDPERRSYGTSSYCTDDQGSAFYLGRH